jgi:DNA-binding response OmpR family regulator
MNTESTRNKILVVDDEPDMLELMMMVLTRKGYQACGATNGTDAIIINAKENPDLIILDLRMLEMDGIETLRHIRKMDAKVRVIILSGLPDGADSPATIKDMADLDVSERLCKQLDNDQVLHAVRDVLER